MSRLSCEPFRLLGCGGWHTTPRPGQGVGVQFLGHQLDGLPKPAPQAKNQGRGSKKFGFRFKLQLSAPSLLQNPEKNPSPAHPHRSRRPALYPIVQGLGLGVRACISARKPKPKTEAMNCQPLQALQGSLAGSLVHLLKDVLRCSRSPNPSQG